MQNEEKVLMAVDLSLSNTGVAIFSLDGKPIKVISISTDSKKERGERLKEIADGIIEIKQGYNLEEIVIEQGFSRYALSTQALYNVQGVILYLLCEYPHFFYAPSTIKKVITGKGNASKAKVQEIVSEIFPDLKIEDNDQSDAVAAGIAHLIEKGVLRR